MRHQEHALQRSVADFLTLALPPDATWTSVDHAPGKGIGPRAGAMRKARGLRAGWPDVQVYRHGVFIGIELKSANGAKRHTQVEIGAEIVRAGGWWRVCRSVEDVERLLRDAGFHDLRATCLSAEAA